MNITLPSDPDVFGPGTWFVIHTLAYNATTPLKIDNFIQDMKLICERLPCKDCSEHALKYIKKNSINKYRDIVNDSNRNIGIFKWTWIFHNDVNSRLGKPILNWSIAYDMYIDDVSVCQLDMCTLNP